MLNFIRFDVSKFFKSKAIWMCIFFLTIFLSIVTFVQVKDSGQSYSDYQLDYQSQEAEIKEEKDKDATIRVHRELAPLMSEEEFNDLQADLKNSMTISNVFFENYSILTIFAFIFFALFVGNDFSTGYLKNMLAIQGAKWKWVTSKMVVAITFFVIMSLVILGFGLVNEVLSQQFLADNPWKDHLILFLPQVLLFMIIMQFAVALILLTQSKVTTIVIATLFGMGLHSQLLNFIGQSIGIDLVSKLYSSQLLSMGQAYHDNYFEVLLIGLIYLSVLYIFNRWYIYKVDFKFDH